MFISYSDPSVRLTGRFFPEKQAAVTTACGSSVELAFLGRSALLHFDISDLVPAFPHVYLQIDGGPLIESALSARLTVRTADAGPHILRIIFKSAVEYQNRWQFPLQAKLAFEGFEADAPAALPPDRRRTVSFIGDSITEGILIFPEQTPAGDKHLDRVYMDDVTKTYAWLTAEHFGLRPTFFAYGAVGMSKGGNGGVPKAIEAYPFYADGVPFPGEDPDLILLNLGANDRKKEAELFIPAYREFLEMIARRCPRSEIVVLSPFCGAHAGPLKEAVEAFSEEHARPVGFIDSTGWVPPEPLHPGEEGHAVIARHLEASLPAVCSFLR